MLVVTGAAGFIGANLIRALNQMDFNDILAVDDLTNGHKFINLSSYQVADYLDKTDFLSAIKEDTLPQCEVIFHQGACSDTTEWNGRYMLENNYQYSKALFHYGQRHGIPLIYASSAAVYGASNHFSEEIINEKPLNVYGYSKLLFDQYVRRHLSNLSAPVVGLRYFNVYGPHETHKGQMASVAYHLYQAARQGKPLQLFGAWDGYQAGQQSRDFIYVDDVIAANLYFWRQNKTENSGIYNLGTGRAEPFQAIAEAIQQHFLTSQIQYIDFPEKLKGHYQSYTCADISRLQAAGFNQSTKTVAKGMKCYLNWLDQQFNDKPAINTVFSNGNQPVI